MTVKVTTIECNDCVFNHKTSIFGSGLCCVSISKKKEIEYMFHKEGGSPDWCPLNNNTVVVTKASRPKYRYNLY